MWKTTPAHTSLPLSTLLPPLPAPLHCHSLSQSLTLPTGVPCPHPLLPSASPPLPTSLSRHLPSPNPALLSSPWLNFDNFPGLLPTFLHIPHPGDATGTWWLPGPSLLQPCPCGSGATQTTGAGGWHVTPEGCAHQGGEETLRRPCPRPYGSVPHCCARQPAVTAPDKPFSEGKAHGKNVFFPPFYPVSKGCSGFLFVSWNLLCGDRMRNRPAMAIWPARGRCQPPGDTAFGIRGPSLPPSLLGPLFPV